jgi:hypothetical protein
MTAMIAAKAAPTDACKTCDVKVVMTAGGVDYAEGVW